MSMCSLLAKSHLVLGVELKSISKILLSYAFLPPALQHSFILFFVSGINTMGKLENRQFETELFVNRRFKRNFLPHEFS